MKRENEAMNTKVCPRCSAVLFADMNVCYGCLYDFNWVSKAPSIAQPEAFAALQGGQSVSDMRGSETDKTSVLETLDESSVLDESGTPDELNKVDGADGPGKPDELGELSQLDESEQDIPYDYIPTDDLICASDEGRAECIGVAAQQNCKVIEVKDAQVVVIVRASTSEPLRQR